jgi:tape measure domain-containing protein
MADATRRVSIRLSLDDGARVKQEFREVGAAGDRELGRVKDGADRASRALDMLDAAVRVISFVGIAAGIRAVVVAGDQLTQSMGRLNMALGNVERGSEVYEALYRNALQTGVAVRESVDAFQRFSIAAGEIGATSAQVLQLVTGLQRIAIASGASSQEVSSASLQLAQGLASGVLQGDELRSILEGLPTLAQALARELGVSIGGLRKLGSEGKLTADTVFPALLRAIQRIVGELDKTPTSLSVAFGQLTAAADQFLARLDRAIDLSNTLARTLSAASRVLDGIRRGAGLTTEQEDIADRRRQRDALEAQIRRLEEEAAGAPATPPRRGSIQRGAAATAQQQAGVDRAARLEELRQQYRELQEEITRGEQAAAERERTEQEAAAQRGAEARSQRARQDADALRRQLDDRFRIAEEYEDRVRRLREAEAAGGISADDRTRLEALALRDRDEALARLNGTTGRATAARRENNDAEREGNDILRERDALIRQNETALERYARRLETLGTLSARAEGIGQPIPDETIAREAAAALEELDSAQQRLNRSTERGSDVARELGLTFSSAFEDAILKGKSFGDVLEALGQDIARIIARQTITNPLASAVSRVVDGIDFGGLVGGLFGGAPTIGASSIVSIGGVPTGVAVAGARANGGPVTSGQTYLVGERGPEWFVPKQSGTVLPNGTAPGGLTFAPTYHIDARGADAGMVPRLRAEMVAIARASVADLEERVNRGGSAARTFGRRA